MALFGLSNVYPPGSGDGVLLHRAARELLPEFFRMMRGGLYESALNDARERFGEQLDWFDNDVEEPPPVRIPPALPESAPATEDDVQGGILRSYDGVTHGWRLVLLAFDGAAALADFLTRFRPTRERDGLPPGGVAANIAFTLEGLRVARMSEAQIAWFPEEFLVGMEARATTLGDVHTNHPRRWRLPVRNGFDNPKEVGDPVSLKSVHAMVQLRVRPQDPLAYSVQQAREELGKAWTGIVQGLDGVRVLSVQWMQRHFDDDGQVIDHFGFTDGGSDPVFDPAQQGTQYPNLVHLGEALLGYDNEADRATQASTDRDRFLRNGSFVVVRKLRQDVAALENAVDAAVASDDAHLTRDIVLAKMMGRYPTGNPKSGLPLIATDPQHPNDFNYEDDKTGSTCPLHAHIRRANPRMLKPSDNDDTIASAGCRAKRSIGISPDCGRRLRRSKSG